MQHDLVLTGAHAQNAVRAQIRRHPAILLNVMVWEVRYCMARRVNWIYLAEFVLCLLFNLLTRPQTDLHVFYHEAYGGVEVDTFSNLGIFMSGGLWLFLIGTFQLLIITDLVAHDLVDRTHELMMSAPIPTWAYIWGRYLAGLSIGLLLSLLLLVCVSLVGFAMHAGLPLRQFQDVPGYRDLGYPAPDLGMLLSFWAVFVLPTIILLTAIGFTVGTLLPKYGNPVKILLCLGWFACMFFGIRVFALNSAAATWDLSPNALQDLLVKQAQTLYHVSVNGDTSLTERMHIVRAIEQNTPDLLPWLLPHTLYACIGLACVFFVAHSFRRFAEISNNQLPATTCV
jgi:ABC-2 family transporter protein